MRNCFTDKPDLTPYTSVKNKIALDEMNRPIKKLNGKAKEFALKSMELDFDEEDKADEDTLESHPVVRHARQHAVSRKLAGGHRRCERKPISTEGAVVFVQHIAKQTHVARQSRLVHRAHRRNRDQCQDQSRNRPRFDDPHLVHTRNWFPRRPRQFLFGPNVVIGPFENLMGIDS